MPTVSLVENAALNEHEAQSPALRRRPRFEQLRAPELIATNSHHDDEHSLPRSEILNPSNGGDAAGILSESHNTAVENPSPHNSLSGVTLVDPPVRWRSSATLFEDTFTISGYESGYEARSEDSLTLEDSGSHIYFGDGRAQTTTDGASYYRQELSPNKEQQLFSIAPESHGEALQRIQSEGLLSLRRPIQLLRHIVIPRRNSRRRRVDLYPSVDNSPQTDAVDVAHTLNVRQNVGSTFPAIRLDDVDQRLSDIPPLDLDDGIADPSTSNSLWNIWREIPTIPSSEEDSSSDEFFPTPASSLHSSLSPALNGQDHPLRSNPTRSSADPLLPASPSPSSPRHNDDDGDGEEEEEEEEDHSQPTPLDLQLPTLPLPSSPSPPPPQSFTFASLPAPTSTLDASWNAWLASRSPSQISLPESVNSNQSAYFTPLPSPVLTHDYIQEQHRRFQYFYRGELRAGESGEEERRFDEVFYETEFWTMGHSVSHFGERGDGDGDSSGEGGSDSESESLRERRRNREGFYRLGARRRSGDGDEEREAGNETVSSSSDSIFGDSFLEEILARGSAFSFENLGFFDSRGSLVEGLQSDGGARTQGTG